MPIHRGRAVICGRDGRTNQRSKCVCHPSNGHGGSSSGRFHPGQPRSRMAMQRMGVQTSQPWPHVRRLPLPTARVFFFFFLPLFHFPPRPLRRARDVVKFPTAHTYVSGREHENSFVSYWKVSRGDREFKVWSLGATYIRWEGRRYTLYIYLPETLFCRTYWDSKVSRIPKMNEWGSSGSNICSRRVIFVRSRFCFILLRNKYVLETI